MTDIVSWRNDKKLKQKKNRVDRQTESAEAQAGADIRLTSMKRMRAMNELADRGSLPSATARERSGQRKRSRPNPPKYVLFRVNLKSI